MAYLMGLCHGAVAVSLLLFLFKPNQPNRPNEPNKPGDR